MRNTCAEASGELPAVQVVVAAQQLGVVLQRRGLAGNVQEAVLALLEEIPLEGKVVSHRCGTMAAPPGGTGGEKMGGTLAWVKGNHGAVYHAVRKWVVAHAARAPDDVQVAKGHGRQE